MSKKYYAIFAPNKFTGIVDDQEKLWDITRGVSGYTSKTFETIEDAVDFMQERTDDFKIDITEKDIPLIFVVTSGFSTGVMKNFRDFKRAIGDYPSPAYKRFQTLKEAITYWEKQTESKIEKNEKISDIDKKSVIMKDIRKKDKGCFKVTLNTFAKDNETYSYCLTYETPKISRFKDVSIFNGSYEDLIYEMLEKSIRNAAVNGYKEMVIQHNIEVGVLSKILKENRKTFRKELNKFVELDKYENLIGISYKRLKADRADYKKGQELCIKVFELLSDESACND